MIKFDFKTYVDNLEAEKKEYKTKISSIKKELEKKESMLDWYDVDTCISKEELKELVKVAKEIKSKADVLVVVGIGGSYLGAKAVIDMFQGYFTCNKPEVIFASGAMTNGFKTVAKMIAAHHGRSEWGAIVDLNEKDLDPMLYILHHIDDLSAKFGRTAIADLA